MQVVVAVVPGESVFDSVEGELALGDAVSVAADDGAEVRMFSEVAVQAVESEDNVVKAAVTVGNFQRDDDAAVIGLLAQETEKLILLVRIADASGNSRLRSYVETVRAIGYFLTFQFKILNNVLPNGSNYITGAILESAVTNR